MNTARLVVLAIALSTGGIAPYLASGSDDKPRPTGTRSPALRSIADLNAVETRSDDQASRRSGSSNVVRHGVSSPTTT